MTSRIVSLVHGGDGDSPSPTVKTEPEDCCEEERTKQMLCHEFSAGNLEVIHEVARSDRVNMRIEPSTFQ